MTILYFIIALGLLIFIHEFGHFLVAKRGGVGVEIFSLGFGPRLFGKKVGETDYRISLLPFGGYVKLTGESAESETADDPKSYVRKSIGRRLSIVLAGPTMNLALAFVVMPLTFMLGRNIPAYLMETPVITDVLSETPAAGAGLQAGDQILSIEGRAVTEWDQVIRQVLLHPDQELELQILRNGKTMTVPIRTATSETTKGGFIGVEPSYLAAERPVIDGVAPSSVADKAGLRPGDKIVRLDGQPVQTWSQLTRLVQTGKGKIQQLTLERGTTQKTLSLQAEWDAQHERYLLGIQKNAAAVAGEIVVRRYGPLASVLEGTKENVRLLGLTVQVLGRLVTLKLSYKSLGGPIRIAEAAGSAAESGLGNFLFFMCFLSLQLGILNLLPIPVLDGGHALFLGIEGIRRRPVSVKAQGLATQVGMFLLLFLMVIVTVNDVDSVWGLGKIWAWVQSLFG